MTPLTSRIFYHASYILLHRPTVDPQDLASASGPAGICLEHSRAAHELATRFGRTFGKYMRYLPRYSWFVAASFDVVLLDSHVAQVQEAALDRLTVWLQTMEQVGRSLGLLSLALRGRSEKEKQVHGEYSQQSLLRAPSMRRPLQSISSRVYEVLVKQPFLAQTLYVSNSRS